jgi:class 3 adenylate cyclase/tetratricopeptide (TPR) repeat protein
VGRADAERRRKQEDGGVKCSSCGRENREGAVFCDGCGTSLAPDCAKCGAQLRVDARFCDSCGAPVQAGTPDTDVRSVTPDHLVEKILEERSRIEGERRTVTVLFADAKGFTSFSEQLDAEKVYEITQSCVERMVQAVHRHEGTVNQFRGDGIMAIFGAPIAHEDSARRAVAAALDMQQALARHIADAGVDIAFRVGLNTGPVVVGRINDDLQMDYTAIGDTVNLASRMEQMAEPGAVYVTEDTQRQVADYFDFEDIGPLDVKGKATPVHAYKVLSARGIRTRLDAAVARGLSPFVGRERDIEVLKGLWHDALAGRGQIVMISGEPGIGKSRLLLEFRRALGDDVIWREAHCVSNGQNTPYLPVIELVKNGFGINETDDEGTIIEKIDADTAMWSTEAQKMAPYLKFLLQVDPGDAAIEYMNPAERRAGILDALRALILERSRVAPRVVVVEDLHWADDQSEEVFRVCADAVAASKVLMILTFRPGYIHPSSDLPNAHRIALGNLDERAQEELATATLEAAALPTDLADAVAGKAEGNPLFIEEVTRALAAGIADPKSVPNSLQDVILARVDRLDRQARESLQLASVIGREFSLRLLDRISDLQSKLNDVLAELKMLELIYEKSFFPELAYMFKHALTHDVAYSTLLHERRRTLHRLVATAIEELYEDRIQEHYEVLAHHYVQAEDWDKALQYLDTAAEKATDSFANSEASGFLTQAIEICERLGTDDARRRLVGFAERQGAVAFALGDLDGAAAAFVKLADNAQQLGDTSGHARGLAKTSMVELYMHDLDRAEQTALRALEITSDDANARAVAKATVWAVTLFTERYEESEALRHEVKQLAADVTDDWTLVTVSATMAPLRDEWSGRHPESLAVIEDALAKFGPKTDLMGYLFGRWAECLNRMSIGEHQRALDQLLEDIPFAERTGVILMYLRALNTVGFIYGDLHDYENAMTWNRRGLREALDAGLPDPEIECNAALNLADNLMALGRLDEAEEHYRWVEGIYRNPTPEQRFMLWRYAQHMLHSYGELWLLRGDAERALAYANECLELAHRSDSPKNELKAYRLRGQVFAARGRLDDARAEFERAISVGRDIGNAGQLWRSYAAYGDALHDAGQPDDARAAYAGALQVIDHIADGLTDDLLRETFLGSERIRTIRAGAVD